MNKLILLALCFFFLEVARAATVGQEIASPVTPKAAPWFWSGVAATAVLVATEDSVSDPATKEVSDDKPVGDLSRLGDLNGQMIPNALYVMGMWAHSKFSENQTSMNRAEHMTKATIYAALATTVLKYTVREPRPDNSHEKNSFPSGHTTTAFAFATVVASQHEWYWGVGAYSMAALTAASRINDGRHFLHDVVGGMTIGIGYGLGLKYTLKDDGRFVVAPIMDGDQKGLRVAYAF